MNENIKQKILEILENANAIRKWNEVIVNEESVHLDNVEEVIQETDEIGITSDGFKYLKKKVFEYLSSQSIPMTEQNVILAAKMFPATDGMDYVNKNSNLVWHNEIEGMDNNELSLFLKAKILTAFSELKETFEMSYIYEYDVDIIRDAYTGVTNSYALKNSIDAHAKRGYRVKEVFTNEIGVNSSSSVGISGVSSGTNATIDEVVIIYEKPAFLTDKKLNTLLMKLKKQDN